MTNDPGSRLPRSGDDDLELVGRILGGDREAFEECFDDLTPRLYRFAASRLHGDPEITREIVQQSVCKAIESLPKFRGESTLFTWMCGICRFEILAWFKSRKRSSSELEMKEELPEVRASLESTAALLESPDARLHRQDIARLVHATLDHLPSHYGRALEWKYCEGLSVNEIAGRLGVGAKATESMLTRARLAFRAAFLGTGGES